MAFPAHIAVRLDLDSIKHDSPLSAVLEKFRKGKIKILMGTQIIAKSFDFPQVALMGILSADSYLEFPDFRSREKTLALLLQASGRAGRGKFPGEVIIQHSSNYQEFIDSLSEHKIEELLESELLVRKQLGFPPYKHLLLIHVQSPHKGRGEEVVGSLAGVFKTRRKAYAHLFELWGPAEAPLFKVRNN